MKEGALCHTGTNHIACSEAGVHFLADDVQPHRLLVLPRGQLVQEGILLGATAIVDDDHLVVVSRHVRLDTGNTLLDQQTAVVVQDDK